MDSSFISNENVIEHVKGHGLDATTKYMIERYPSKLSNITYKALLSHITRIYQKYQHLNKSKTRVKGKQHFDSFMKDTFIFPSSKESTPCKTNTNDKCLTSATPFQPNDNPVLQATVYKEVAEKLANELCDTKYEMVTMEEELEVLTEEKDTLNESLDANLDLLNKSQKALKRTANREAYWRDKVQKVQQNLTAENVIHDLRLQILELKETLCVKNEEIKNLKHIIDELNIENLDLKKIENMDLFDVDSNSYISELHACVYTLLDNHVSCEHVSNVIESVLKLCKKKANKLPCASTINNWSIERSLIARRHISQCSENKNTTLHTDEASKYGSKWGAFGTRDAEGNYLLLGLRDMATKSSSDTLETFKDILYDIDLAGNCDTDTAKKILVNIKNTMSDRASTETKFNDMLKEYRDTILPEVIENFNLMNEESKQAISSMNNFFCGLHTLVHMADASQKSLFEIEKAHFDGNIPIDNPSFAKSGQSGTVRLIHTACKAFARRGDQKSGCHQGFKTYIADFLKQNNILGLPLQPLRGNRFNILFSNAGHVYFLKDKMTEYLDKISSMNGLLQSVLKDLKTPFFLAGCKALGLISKIITTPLWKVIESKNVSISMMSEKYLALLTFLNDVVKNLEEFIKGELVLYDDIPIKKDIVYTHLVQPSEYDGNVILILSVIIPALSKLIQRQYGDHLPGGKYEIINPDITASVDKHNKFPERVFSYVDHILTAKPNIKTLALESQITFSLNKTSEWLSGQENMNEIIKESRSGVKAERVRFKQREQTILAKRVEKQEEDFRKKVEQERRRIEKLERETADMLFYGLWQNVAQMESELEKIESKKEKEEALKVQLRFRKNVFNQKSESPNVYTFSKQVDGKRVPLSVDELKDKVASLIENAYQVPPPEQPHMLVGKYIEHKWIENDAPKWYNGRVISQVPGFPAWFNVVYEDDDAVYTSKLGEEYRAGDVIIRELF